MIKSKLTRKESNEMNHFNLMASNYDANYGYNDLFTAYKINKKMRYFKEFVDKNIATRRFKIVEMGCGTGEYTKLISEMYPNASIIALDISDDILKIAKLKCKKNKNVKFMNRSAYSTGINKRSVDLVCGFYFLHHIDLKKVGSEIFNILKIGGSAFFYEPNILNPLVYLIKSNKTLKKIFGDSPDEWAMNPVTIRSVFPKFKTDFKTSEFIYPARFLPAPLMVSLDKLTSFFSYIPLLKYLGGSVAIKLIKSKA